MKRQSLKKRNPAVEGGASRNQLGGWLQHSLTASESQAQILTRRFRLSRWMARDVARLCFGEAQND